MSTKRSPAEGRPSSALHLRRKLAALPVIFLLFPGGCREADAGASDAVTVRDSAGIAVAEVVRPAWGDGEGWVVDPEPRLRIGRLEGPPEEELHDVADALLAPDGSVVLADGGSGQIRVFDASGAHVRSFGRTGDGPGELRAVRGLHLEGDVLLVYDARPGRITRFTLDGELLEVTTLDVPEGRRPPSRVAWLPVGAVVGAVSWAETSEGSRTVPDGELRRNPVALLRFEQEGRLADTLLVHPGSEVFHVSSAEGGGVFRTFETTPPFGRVSVWAVTAREARTTDGAGGASGAAGGIEPAGAAGEAAVWVGTGDGYELRGYGPYGALRRMVRHPEGEIPLDPARIDSARASALEGLDDSPRFRRMVELLYRQDGQPSTLPPYSAMLVDAEEHLWLQEYRPPEGRPVRWDVFRPDGTLLGTVEVPARFRPLRIGGDHLLGIATDDLDVERVAVLELRR